MKSFLQLKSADEIVKIIFSLPTLSGEIVPLEKAIGRRIFHPFRAPEALPGFRRSAMDGYAVRARDTFGASEINPALLSVQDSCQMGRLPDFELKPGNAAEIYTGAPLPEGADSIVMVEHTRKAGDSQIEVIKSVAPGINMVGAEDDASSGEVLMEAGALLRAQEIGLLAAFGVEKVDVFRRAKVAIISSGDEIEPIYANIRPGQVRDVNSWSLDAICIENGAAPERLGIVRDNSKALRDILRKACLQADAVVVSGGSSAGARDYTVEAFMEMENARLLVHGAAISPGKPFILAATNSVCLLGLPGHVSSALICAHIFLAPLLNHLQGLPEPAPKPWFEAILTRSIASAQGRRDYIRCRLERAGDEYTVTPLTMPSAVIRGLVLANALVICPENAEGLSKGQKVRAYPIACFA